MGGIIGAAKQPDALAYGIRSIYDKTKDKSTAVADQTVTGNTINADGSTRQAKRVQSKATALQIPTA